MRRGSGPGSPGRRGATFAGHAKRRSSVPPAGARMPSIVWSAHADPRGDCRDVGLRQRHGRGHPRSATELRPHELVDQVALRGLARQDALAAVSALRRRHARPALRTPDRTRARGRARPSCRGGTSRLHRLSRRRAGRPRQTTRPRLVRTCRRRACTIGPARTGSRMPRSSPDPRRCPRRRPEHPRTRPAALPPCLRPAPPPPPRRPAGNPSRRSAAGVRYRRRANTPPRTARRHGGSAGDATSYGR